MTAKLKGHRREQLQQRADRQIAVLEAIHADYAGHIMSPDALSRAICERFRAAPSLEALQRAWAESAADRATVILANPSMRSGFKQVSKARAAELLLEPAATEIETPAGQRAPSDMSDGNPQAGGEAGSDPVGSAPVRREPVSPPAEPARSRIGEEDQD